MDATLTDPTVAAGIAARQKSIQDAILLNQQNEAMKTEQEQRKTALAGQQQETAQKQQLPVAVSDIMGWQADPRYQESWANLPQEAKAHQINAYPELAPKAPEIWNKALEDNTGQVAGTENMDLKSMTAGKDGSQTRTYLPKQPGIGEPTDQDRENGRMLAAGTTTVDKLIPGRTPNAAAARQRAFAEAEKIVPGFTAQTYAATEKAKKDFSGSGQAAQQVSSLNTILDHLGQLSDSYKGLNNGGNQFANEAGNYLTSKLKGNSNQAGDIEKFKTNAIGVAAEISKLLKGGVASEGEQKEWNSRFDPSQAPAQLKANIEEAMKLIAGRVGGLHTQWESAYGEPKGRPLLSPKSIAIIRDKLGMDPNQVDPGMSAQPAQPVAPSTTAPAATTQANTADKFTPGKQYRDGNGNTATYLGNGKWQ